MVSSLTLLIEPERSRIIVMSVLFFITFTSKNLLFMLRTIQIVTDGRKINAGLDKLFNAIKSFRETAKEGNLKNRR